jgi:hypothetical protein
VNFPQFQRSKQQQTTENNRKQAKTTIHDSQQHKTDNETETHCGTTESTTQHRHSDRAANTVTAQKACARQKEDRKTQRL